MTPVRLAVLGTGAMAEYQVKKFSALENVTVVACFDTDLAKSQRFAGEHGLDHGFDDLNALLARPLDAVSCCLVDARHFEAGRAVLGSGKALFCEKPLASTLTRARELAAAASESGLPVMVNLSKRNAPALWLLKDAVDSGRLGTVLSVDAHYRQSWVVTKAWGDWTVEPRWKWRLQSAFCTAGVVGDLGVHLMDALCLLFGSPSEVRRRGMLTLPSAMDAGLVPRTPLDPGFLPNQETRPAYVALEADLIFGGVPCQFSLSWIDPSAVDSFGIRVEGTRAVVELDLEVSRTACMLNGTSDIEGRPVESTYQKFIAAVRSGCGGSPGVVEALAAQEALEGLLERVQG